MTYRMVTLLLGFLLRCKRKKLSEFYLHLKSPTVVIILLLPETSTPLHMHLLVFPLLCVTL